LNENGDLMEETITSSGTWDLTNLFKDFTDPKIDSTLKQTEEQVDELVSQYYGKIKIKTNQPSIFCIRTSSKNRNYLSLQNHI
jgi:hypothetical protein